LSKVQVDTIDTRSGTSTMQIGSTNTSTINIGVSGDTVNIPSGVTIANAGTATGFGSNSPIFRAQMGGSDQTVSDDTFTKLNFSNEIFDIGGQYDATTNYRFTPTSAGKYLIGASAFYYNTATNIYRVTFQLYKNGSAHSSLGSIGSSDNSLNIGYGMVGNSTIVDANGTGDYFEIYGMLRFSSGTGQFNSGTASNFFGAKLMS